MEPVTQKFRRALNGFNRWDVMRYIEQSSTAHNKQVAELEQQLGQARQELDGAGQERNGLLQELDSLRSRQGSLAAEEARVRSSLEESTRDLTKLRGELTQTETKLGVARAELARLQEKVEQLSPMAERYEQLKDRVATVELDAHRKAQATIDEAQGQAEEIRERARQWLGRTLEGYDGLRQAMDGLFARARSVSDWEEQLRQADERAHSLREELLDHE